MSLLEYLKKHQIKLTNIYDLELIIQFPDEDWNWKTISRHKELNLNFLKKIPHKIDWKTLSYNSNLQLSWLLEFPEKEWDIYRLSTHRNLTL